MSEGPGDQPNRESTAFSAFDHLLETCRRTHAVLHAVVHDEARDEDVLKSVLAREALGHVESVLDGLVLLATTGQFTADELRTMVRRAGIVGPARPGTAEAEAALAQAAHEPGGLRRIDLRMMLAAGHARVVFSVIPFLPPDAVSWPRQPRSYADIPVPRSAGEQLTRAEELARVVWRVATGDVRQDEPLRRTLAFYEAGARLSFRGFQAA